MIMFVSAAPIALLVNMIRITLTGICNEKVGATIAGVDPHDLFGYLMPPVALGMLWIEKLILGKLLIEQPEGSEMVFNFAEVGSAESSCAV